jgi:lipopolysaccharide assembly outer membrane protein LptD (OstA)
VLRLVQSIKILIKVILIALLLERYTNASFLQSDIQSTEITKNQIFLQADKISVSNQVTQATGRVLLKGKQVILNSDLIFAAKSNICSGNNCEDNILFQAYKYVKIRMEDGTFIYAKSIFYDQEKDYAKIDYPQIFPSENIYSQIFAKKIEQITKNYKNEAEKETEYVLQESIISLCSPQDRILKKERTIPFDKAKDSVPLTSYDNILNKNPDHIYWKRCLSPISISAAEMKINTKTHLASMKHGVLRIFGIPLFYMPSFSIHTNKHGGDTGLLLPRLMIMGRKQMGLEIPFYIRLRNDMDLVISRTDYFSLPSPLGSSNQSISSDPRYSLLDLKRMRASVTGLLFRHLVSDKYNYSSYYKFEGLLTDRTVKVDDNTGLASVDEFGNVNKGYRGYFELTGKMQLGKNLFLNIDYLYSSDKNFLYIYKMDYRQYKINTLSLFDVTDNHYHQIDLVNFQPLIVNLAKNTMPIVMPVVRSEFNFRKDKIGGNFYMKNRFSTIERTVGYDHTNFALDFGYNLPYISKSGYKITFDSLARGQYDHLYYSGIYDATAIIPSQYYTFGNYGGMLQNDFYIKNQSNGHYAQFLNFNKLQLEMPFISQSDIGTTIIEPKMAFRYIPNSGRKDVIVNDDAFGIKMSYNNAFSLLQTNGLGAYDSGGSFVYGIDLTHKFDNSITKGLEIKAGVAQSLRLIDSVTENILPQSSSFYNSRSDILGQFILQKTMNSYNIQIGINYRYDTIRKILREMTSYAAWSGNRFMVSLNYSKFSKQASIFNREVDIMQFFTRFEIYKNLVINMSAGYNFSDSPIPGLPQGRTGITILRYGMMHTVGCIDYGFAVSENHMAIGNIPTIRTYRFIIRVNGIG